MIYFIDKTPFIEIALENPFMEIRYPEEGFILGVVDTGYEGFLLVPMDIFNKLGFNQLKTIKRSLILPNGEEVESMGYYGKITAESLGVSIDGYIETFEGIGEIIVGPEVLAYFHLALDYCKGILSLRPCKSSLK